MNRKDSIQRSLERGFSIIALVASVVLAIFLYIDFELFRKEILEGLGAIGLLHETIDHVLFPIAVLLFPLVFATQLLLRKALEPLQVASDLIRRSTGKDRGFRLQAEEMPEEIEPFITAINKLLSRLDDAARGQEGFAADIAHELKSGLSAIMLELEAIDHDGARRSLEDITSMNRLIDQILMLARLDAYIAAPQAAGIVQLNEAALDSLKLMARYCSESGVGVGLVDNNPPGITGHYEAIVAAMRNLIENAVRVTPNGGEVTVTCGPGPVVRVTDGGAGIPATELKMLCDRFRRAERASEVGAGLGLSIVSRVMLLHGGKFETDPLQSSLILTFPEAGQ